ncbi:MAG: DsbC family protein [Gallionella sp.]|nr:DsbC family protein [Gallionella sp.]
MRLNLILPSLLLCLLSGAALADEASVKKLLQKQFPDEGIESVKKTPYLGLYEAVTNGQLFYTDEKASYFFFGHIVDPKTMQSFTEERMQQIKNSRTIKFDSLPLELAIKSVKGNGQRKLAVFSDPNCPYCKQLEKELAKVTDVTIYTMLYPVLRGSEDVAKAIWCSADRLKAWDDLMLRGIAPTGQNCETPLATLLQTGRKHRVSGTPTMVFADGSIAPGMIPVEMIEKRLNGKNGTGKK